MNYRNTNFNDLFEPGHEVTYDVTLAQNHVVI